ncbi:MAG: hypothetical protein ACE5OZ_04225 [Candidatus Heimdallarchaeota archaeon]
MKENESFSSAEGLWVKYGINPSAKCGNCKNPIQKIEEAVVLIRPTEYAIDTSNPLEAYCNKHCFYESTIEEISHVYSEPDKPIALAIGDLKFSGNHLELSSLIEVLKAMKKRKQEENSEKKDD